MLSEAEILFRKAACVMAVAMVLLIARLGTTSSAGVKKADVEPPALPPTMPDGKTIATFSSPGLLEPPVSMQDVSVAKTPPVIDFLYYPGQDYEGKPWSNWGDGVATPGKYYSAIGDHRAPDGNAFVYEYSTGTRTLKKVVAFLHPILKKRFGYTPLGTFSTAVSPSGKTLYITWNGNLGGLRRGRLTWDACALTVVHIPQSERLP